MEHLTVSVVTLGCKVNQAESADIVHSLNSLGDFEIAASEGIRPSDVYVLNTCSVTAEADRKSRQYITKLKKISPSCNIIVVGCSSQNCKQNFEKPNVFAVGGAVNKKDFVIDAIKKLYDQNKSILSDRILLQEKHGISSINNGKTRTFIKIQDGCDRFCTYCIIPYLRGRSVSRKIEDIAAECERCESQEIVLTGIDMSYYGRDIGSNLAELLDRLSSATSARKRLGSLECEVIDEQLLSVMERGGYCPHFHLSLQSGSDDVLKTMNRRYDTEYYFEKVCLIRKFFPLAGITTDLIVGFPTESDKDFDKTLDFAYKCGFSDIHVFPYSRRVGTIAAKKYGELPPDIVEHRMKRALKLKAALRTDFLKKNIGTVAAVYTEDSAGTFNQGYTPNYIKVYSDAECGKISDLKLSTLLYKDGIIGTPV